MRKCNTNTGNIGEIVKTRTTFLARYGDPRTPKTVQKRSFFPTSCFHTFPGICQRCRPEVLSQTAKKCFFARGSIPKVLITRWKKGPNQRNTLYFTVHTDVQPRTRHQIHAPPHHLVHIPSVYRYMSCNVEPLKRWQHLAWATRRLRPRFECRCQRRSGGCKGSARETTWCRATLGDDVVRRLVCVWLSSHLLCHISRISLDLCVFFSGTNDKVRRFFLPGCLLLALLWTHHAASVQRLVLPDNVLSHARRLACDHNRTESSFNRRVPQISLPQTSLCGTSSRHTSFSIHLSANPSTLRALLIPVHHRTWTGSRWMFENMGNARVRRRKACGAIKGGFFEQ